MTDRSTNRTPCARPLCQVGDSDTQLPWGSDHHTGGRGRQVRTPRDPAIRARSVTSWRAFESPTVVGEQLSTPPPTDSLSQEPSDVPRLDQTTGVSSRLGRTVPRSLCSPDSERERGYWRDPPSVSTELTTLRSRCRVVGGTRALDSVDLSTCP